MSILLDGHSLSLSIIESVAINNERVKIHPDAVERADSSCDYVNEIVNNNQVVYGINTGFGKLANKKIDKSQLSCLQINLIRSHAVGVGKALPEPIIFLQRF